MAADKTDTPPFADFSAWTGQVVDQWEKGMTSWWDQVLESPAFLNQMGQSATAQARARRAYEDSVDETLKKLHLPTRDDVVRMTRIATLLEEKLLQVEDRLLEVQDELTATQKEVVKARIEAAEARLEQKADVAALSEQLTALRAQLEAVEAKVGPTKAPARKRTTRRTAAKAAPKAAAKSSSKTSS